MKNSLVLLSTNLVYQKFFPKRKLIKSQEIPNLILANREARFREPSDSEITSPNQWATLGVAHQNLKGFSESCVLEGLYEQTRTHFIKNS